MLAALPPRGIIHYRMLGATPPVLRSRVAEAPSARPTPPRVSLPRNRRYRGGAVVRGHSREVGTCWCSGSGNSTSLQRPADVACVRRREAVCFANVANGGTDRSVRGGHERYLTFLNTIQPVSVLPSGKLKVTSFFIVPSASIDRFLMRVTFGITIVVTIYVAFPLAGIGHLGPAPAGPTLFFDGVPSNMYTNESGRRASASI